MVFIDLNMELHATPIAKLGARKMESYRLPFCAVIALWLLTVQVIAAERPVLGQGMISCSLWLEGRQSDSPSAAMPWLVRHSKRTRAIIRQNITFALATKAVFVVLTFVGMASLWGAIAADMGASLLVVLNGLRLLNGAARP
jgi:hypothetical protein